MARACGADFDVAFISQSGDQITAAKGMKVEVHHGIADAPPADLLLIPGGQGTRREVENRALSSWIAQTAVACRAVALPRKPQSLTAARSARRLIGHDSTR